VEALAVAPDGSWLASASNDRTVRVWDPATGTPRHTLTGHTDTVSALAVAPDGSWLASASNDRTVRVWTPGSGECLAALRVDGPLSTMGPLPGALVVGGASGVYLFSPIGFQARTHLLAS
jgi:WD40 repeat protein